MNPYVVRFALVLGLVASGFAQGPPTLEDQLTSSWRQKNYTELRNLLDAKTAASPPDVVALYCSKFFYIFIEPNKPKALMAMNKLKAEAEATTDPDFIAFANDELAEVQAIPDAEFTQRTAEVLAMLHSEFANKYPNVDMAARLRRFKKP